MERVIGDIMRKLIALWLAVMLLLGVLLGGAYRADMLSRELVGLELEAESRRVMVEVLEEEIDRYNIVAGRATGYAPGDNISGLCADSNPEITSTGVEPGESIIAVDPDIIPYNSRLTVVGEDFRREGYALDTGADMRSADYPLVDLWFASYEEAKEFGKNKVIIIWRETEK